MRYLLSLPALVVVVAVMAAPCVAQQTLIGYSPASAAREREAEADAIRRPDPARAAAHSRALSQETHVAGTAAHARLRHRSNEGVGTRNRGSHVRHLDASRDRGAGLASSARYRAAESQRAGRAERSGGGVAAISDRKRLQRPGRCHR